jgi:glycosyltransferase involved in cell wall biosynthesis
MMPPEPASSLAIVMPVLNEAAGIEAALRALAPLRARGARVVVADGGSADDTLARARRFGGVEVIQAPRGRAAQMNAGALAASGDRVLLFLHADTTLPPDADRLIAAGAGRRPPRLGPLRRAHRRRIPGCCAWWRPA